MGIGDLFKKSASDRFDALNAEQLLEKAATEPAYRTEFYRRLLTENLYVITSHSNLPEGASIAQEGTTLNIVSFPDGKIPAFTSTERIFDKGVIQEQVEYISMKGKDLLTTLKGATVLLNPYSDYGKELIPAEIERLLDGSIFNDVQRIQIDKPTNVLIGQPAKYPLDMVNSLKKLFEERRSVKTAYLGWIHDPKSDVPPHYIIGLEMDSDSKTTVDEAGFTAKQYLASNEFVDFIKVGDGMGLDSYFRSVKPFFVRTD
jgi:hypothetical protein